MIKNTQEMPVGGEARGEEQGGRLHKFSELSQRESDRAQDENIGCDLIDTQRQDNVSPIVWNKRASDFTPGEGERRIGEGMIIDHDTYCG